MASLEFSGPNRWQLGITQLQNLARKSEQKKRMISEKVEIEENEKLCLLEPAPMAESARPSAATPVMPPAPARQGSAPMTTIPPAAVEMKAKPKPLDAPAPPRLNVESRDRSQSSDVTNTGQVPKKQKMVTQDGTTSADPGTTGDNASSSAQLAQAEAEWNEAAVQHIPTHDSMNSDDSRVSTIEAIYDG